MIFLKGLLHLLQVTQKPQIGGKFTGRLGNPGQGGQNGGIHLAGVGLTTYGYSGCKAHLLRNFAVQLQHFLMVALKEFQKAGLGTGGPLYATERKPVDPVLHLIQIHQQLIHPEGGPFSHGDKLCRLKVSKTKGRKGFILVGKIGQNRQHTYQLIPDESKALPHKDEVGIVADITTGGAQVDNGHSLGALLSVGVNVGHHVVAELLFPLGGGVVIDVVQMGFQLGHLFGGDWEAQFHLSPGQGHPQAPPG